MKKILFFYLRKLFPAALLTFIIIYFWSIQSYWIATQNEIFDPVTLKIYPIEYQTISQIVGVWKYFLLVTFNLLFFLGLAYLFKFKIQREEYFPRKIFLGTILIALSVVIVFAPVIVVSISSNQSSLKICSELSKRRNIVKGLVGDYQKSLLNKKPEVDEIKKLIKSNSFSILAQNIDEYYSFSKPIEDSVSMLKDDYEEIFNFKKILADFHCSDSDSLLSFPDINYPIYELATLSTQLMDSVLMKNSWRKRWGMNKFSEFISAREAIGKHINYASNEQLIFYCTLGDSFYKLSDYSLGDKCYRIATRQTTITAIEHLYDLFWEKGYGLAFEILDIIEKELRMSEIEYKELASLGRWYYGMSYDPVSGISEDNVLKLGSRCFEIVASSSILRAIYYLPLINPRQRSILFDIIAREFNLNDWGVDLRDVSETISSLVNQGDISTAESLWNMTFEGTHSYPELFHIEYDYDAELYYLEYDYNGVINDSIHCPLPRLWGDRIVADLTKLSSLLNYSRIIGLITLADQKKYNTIMELGTRVIYEGNEYKEPFVYALAVKEINNRLFNEYKQQLWNDIKHDNGVLWVCELFSKIGIYMMQFNDTTAVRLAISDFDNAIAFWTESYGGWINNYHSDQKQLAYYAAKREEAISKLTLLKQSQK